MQDYLKQVDELIDIELSNGTFDYLDRPVFDYDLAEYKMYKKTKQFIHSQIKQALKDMAEKVVPEKYSKELVFKTKQNICGNHAYLDVEVKEHNRLIDEINSNIKKYLNEM